jgi:hypothetical protein
MRGLFERLFPPFPGHAHARAHRLKVTSAVPVDG